MWYIAGVRFALYTRFAATNSRRNNSFSFYDFPERRLHEAASAAGFGEYTGPDDSGAWLERSTVREGEGREQWRDCRLVQVYRPKFVQHPMFTPFFRPWNLARVFYDPLPSRWRMNAFFFFFLARFFFLRGAFRSYEIQNFRRRKRKSTAG